MQRRLALLGLLCAALAAAAPAPASATDAARPSPRSQVSKARPYQRSAASGGLVCSAVGQQCYSGPRVLCAKRVAVIPPVTTPGLAVTACSRQRPGTRTPHSPHPRPAPHDPPEQPKNGLITERAPLSAAAAHGRVLLGDEAPPGSGSTADPQAQAATPQQQAAAPPPQAAAPSAAAGAAAGAAAAPPAPRRVSYAYSLLASPALGSGPRPAGGATALTNGLATYAARQHPGLDSWVTVAWQLAGLAASGEGMQGWNASAMGCAGRAGRRGGGAGAEGERAPAAAWVPGAASARRRAGLRARFRRRRRRQRAC
jgi:hypothetical protein